MYELGVLGFCLCNHGTLQAQGTTFSRHSQSGPLVPTSSASTVQ